MRYLLIPAKGHYDEAEGLTLKEHAEQIAADLGMVLAPPDVRDDGMRFRMMIYLALSEGTPEAQTMDQLSRDIPDPDTLSEAEQRQVLRGLIDQVRTKFGDRHA